MSKNFYFNRDLSWLGFNKRVLEEASDMELPLYERIKFLAIYASNLDEFYRVRVASYRNLLSNAHLVKNKSDIESEEVLRNINIIVRKQVEEFNRVFNNTIVPELYAGGIVLYQEQLPEKEHLDVLDLHFRRELMPYLQPVLLAGTKIRTFLQDNMLYLGIRLYNRKESKSGTMYGKPKFAILKMPTNYHQRFVVLPRIMNKHYIIFLEDIIRLHLDILFPGYIVDSAYSFKMSPDADYVIEDEYEGNLLDKIKSGINLRKIGAPSLFMFDSSMPYEFLNLMKEVFEVDDDDLVPSGRYLNFADFFDFPNPVAPALERQLFDKLRIPALDRYGSIYKAIAIKDRCIQLPYHTYDYVTDFIARAALDPTVVEIKVTQYRVAKNSDIIEALLLAAKRKRKVTVFVEAKARFDEANNMFWAEKMRQAGIKIISSIPGVKVHAKIALVIRHAHKEGKINGYVYTSTGNFNEKTAKVYADHGLFTANSELVHEFNELFNYLENQNYKPEINHLWIPKINFQQQFEAMVQQEIDAAMRGEKANILLKINGLEHKYYIDLLYKAAMVGVAIDIIVRGVCCMIPNPNLYPKLRITRIVDKYLEHARVYVFYNGGKNTMYISSADLMIRNMERRIEAATPIFDEDIKHEIIDMLNIQLIDNYKARFLDAALNNVRKPERPPKVRAQVAIYKYLRNKLKYKGI